MNTLLRDFAIVAVLLLAALAWNVFNAASGRNRRRRERDATEIHAREAAREAPLTGATAPATAGWTGPSTDPPTNPAVQDYVHAMTGHLWRVGSSTGGSASQDMHETRYTNAYTGEMDGRAWYAANAYTGQLPVSVCTVAVGVVLPPLWVGPRDIAPYVHLMLKEVTLESEDFDRTFRVQALDRKYASDVVSPRVMQLLMLHEDWTFFLAFSSLVCVAKTPYVTVDDVRARVAAVDQLVSLVPSFVETDRGLQLPTLPDGTPVDITDPASRQRLQEWFETMSPEERQRTMLEMKAKGAAFLAGMFGKELPPELDEKEQPG